MRLVTHLAVNLKGCKCIRYLNEKKNALCYKVISTIDFVLQLGLGISTSIRPVHHYMSVHLVVLISPTPSQASYHSQSSMPHSGQSGGWHRQEGVLSLINIRCLLPFLRTFSLILLSHSNNLQTWLTANACRRPALRRYKAPSRVGLGPGTSRSKCACHRLLYIRSCDRDYGHII